MTISDKTFLSLVVLMAVITIASTAFIFLVTRNYDVVLEAPCDPAQGVCFTRDCSGGECPANELELYRVFVVHADDFEKCADDSCLSGCATGRVDCTEILCGESGDDVCSTDGERPPPQ